MVHVAVVEAVARVVVVTVVVVVVVASLRWLSSWSSQEWS